MWNLQATVLITLLQLLHHSESLKFILIPMMSGSHILRHGWIGKGLIDRGHQAYMIKHKSIPVPSQLYDFGIVFINYTTDEEIHFIQTRNCTDMYNLLSKDPLQGITGLMQFFNKQCRDLLTNNILFETLKTVNFDFALVDGFNTLQCFLAIPRRLGIPYAAVGLLPPLDRFSQTLQANFLSPTLPNAGLTYSKKPSLLHRLNQFFEINMLSFLADYHQNSEELHEYLKDEPLERFDNLRNNVRLWLVDNHPIVDIGRVTVPNVINVGGLTAGPVEPVPTDLLHFADSATEGLIIVAFGTVVTFLPEEDFCEIIKALNNLTRQKVILATPQLPSMNLQPHIRLEKWIPQNDLLGHRNTRLFITHCGSSSQHQAIYHGVPMLGITYHSEQEFNARRMAERGFGSFITPQRQKLKAETLKLKIEKMLSNLRSFQKLKNASDSMKHRMVEPEAQAAYWLEHVAIHGAQHLTPFTQQLAWYEILMIDMLVVGVTTALAIIVSMVMFCRIATKFLKLMIKAIFRAVQ